MGTRLSLMVDDRAADVEVEQADGRLRVRVGERWYTAEIERLNNNGLYSLLIGGRSWELFARDTPGGGFELLLGNRVYRVSSGRRGRGDRQGGAGAGAAALLSPMAGVVVEVRVAAGDSVAQGQPVVVVESMKMNNELPAPRDGTVAEVLAGPGQRVERGVPLLRFA